MEEQINPVQASTGKGQHMNAHSLTSSDRVTIAAVHKKGADRRLFGRLTFSAAEGVEFAEIYAPEARPEDLPALIVTRQTLDAMHILSRGFDMLATAERLGPI